MFDEFQIGCVPISGCAQLLEVSMNDTRTTVAGMWFTALLGFLILLTMLSEELLFFFGFIVVFSAVVVLFGWISKPSAYKLGCCRFDRHRLKLS